MNLLCSEVKLFLLREAVNVIFSIYHKMRKNSSKICYPVANMPEKYQLCRDSGLAVVFLLLLYALCASMLYYGDGTQNWGADAAFFIA